MKKVNRELLNMADYEDEGVVKYLFRSYDKLKWWASRGDTVAHSIIIDLESCMKHDYLSERHKKVLRDFYIRGFNLVDCAKEYNITKEGVRKRKLSAIDRVQKLLTNKEKLYN